ncbi:YitT family protein [Clostridium gasigenes]|nr:YitT family protein [Clostridium gasigenes]MBU3104825.1 YitT family protein [Clostridium gasigenes]MBU3133512.1 YitT family protein [Clostridium gasigenes]MBU3137244.1 YitT family protein [Clostridium gasigenes]NKF07769.1 YitT family protein [Clostridium gasigenes]QSW21382.1 YitT family protein [Clostridium gasigenes]
MLKIRQNKTVLLDFIIIFLGCLIASLGVNLFLTNAKLLSGGATGVALILQYTANISSGITVFIINLPLFLISYKRLNKRFTLYSAIGMISLSLSLIITKPLSQLIKIDDILVYCIYGGVLCGLGYGLVFLRNGSTGGVDIITMVIRKKYPNFEIGKVSFGINCIIVLIGAIIFGLPKALYTFISIFLQSVVVDRVLNGFNSKKLLLILTEKEQDMINYIIKDMHRGVTSLIAEGEYTHNRKKMLYCAVTSSQMIHVKLKLLKIDPKAFITIIDVSEVNGKGFRHI